MSYTQVGQLWAMETSKNPGVFFCSGSTAKVEGRSEGVLAAVTFDRNLNLIVEKVLDGINLQACTALRRFPGTDDLAVGSFKHILIVSWSGNNFILNNLIENVHSSKTGD